MAELVDGRLRGAGGGHGGGARARGRRPRGGRGAAGADARARGGDADLHRRAVARRAPTPSCRRRTSTRATTGSRSQAASTARRSCGRAARTYASAIGVLEPGRVLTRRRDRTCSPPSATRRCACYRRPRVAILSTGNELADLGAEPGPGQIPNTNTYSLMAQVLEAGAEPINLGRGAATGSRPSRSARAGGRDADVLVSSAGVSVGELDLVREALDAGRAPSFISGRCRCGPASRSRSARSAVARSSGCPAIPVSAMVTFELFVRPALLQDGGPPRVSRVRECTRARSTPVPNPGSRRGYLRVHARSGRRRARRPAHRRAGLGDPALDGRRRRTRRRRSRHRGRRLEEIVEVIVLRELP